MTETCSVCRFFEAPTAGRANGECRRYPQKLVKGPGEWCGEWFEMRDAPVAETDETRDNAHIEGDDVP